MISKFTRRTSIRHVITVIVGLVLSLMTVQVLAADLDAIKQRGTLNVGVPQDYPPFGSIGSDLQLQGYDVDTARYLAKKMGVKVKLIPVSSINRIPYLTSGRADLIISSLGKTPEREKAIDFSHAYAPFFYAIYSSNNKSLSGPQDLSGKTIGATRGALEEIELTKIAPKDTTIRRYEDNGTTIAAFESGQVDYFALGSPVAAELVRRGGSRIPHLALKLKNSPCYIGMAKGNSALQKEVNDLIDEGIKDGTFNSMSEKWFAMPLPKDMASQ